MNYPGVDCFADALARPLPAKRLHMYAGGAPCTPWADGGKRLGFDDPRSSLFFEQLRLIYLNRPLLAYLENSKRLFTSDGGEFVRGVLALLQS